MEVKERKRKEQKERKSSKERARNNYSEKIGFMMRETDESNESNRCKNGGYTVK